MSYNPCFSGSSSATKTAEEVIERHYSVTILVFLAALVQPKNTIHNPLFSFCALQSLFFWQL